MSVLHVMLAILGLGFLIFIHELGHYIVARRNGMRVEVFSVGFGKPIWKRMRNGVLWQVGWIPLGGFVKIAGMEKEPGKELHEIKEGFFSKSPIARIQVLLAGPLTNIAFALLAFTLIWAMGGRDKPFSRHTQRVGWVDVGSELYVSGVRPGDKIVAYDGHEVKGHLDHLYAGLLSDEDVVVEGEHIRDQTGMRNPFRIQVTPYLHPTLPHIGLRSTGILEPARYIIYDRFPNGEDNPLPSGSPLLNKGLQPGDRFLWVDGHLIYSLSQLESILAEERALITVQRGDRQLLRRVPRLPISEFQLQEEQREELNDWNHEVGLGTDVGALYYIPYDLTLDGVVEGVLTFIDKEEQERAFPEVKFSEVEDALLPGDVITSVDGVPVHRSYDLLKRLQQRQVHVMVQRGGSYSNRVSVAEAEESFDQDINWTDFARLVNEIGHRDPNRVAGNLVMLQPVTPKPYGLLWDGDPKEQAKRQAQMEKELDRLRSLEDPDQREAQLKAYQKLMEKKVLGAPGLQDRVVRYNPEPIGLLGAKLQEMKRNLTSLVSGDLNPKWLSGPVGIVQVMQHGVAAGFSEGLYWLGFVSMALGFLNLLPIPVLDGGYIVLSLWEMVTGKRIKAQTLDRLIVPFVILFLGFFIYVSFHDIGRLFGFHF